MFLGNVKPALSIGGAFGGCIVDFIFPPVMRIFSGAGVVSPEEDFALTFWAFAAFPATISTCAAMVDAANTFGA